MEKTKETNQITIDITDLGLFNGLYETVWLNSNQDIDEVMELADIVGVDWNDIDVSINYNEYLKAIAELYIEMFENDLDNNGVFTVDSVYSPMYYNFDTDHVIINWDSEMSLDDMERKLKELCDDNDDRDDWTIEMELWSDKGSEVYNELVSYKYNDNEPWYNMDSEDIAKVKGE